jgi:predicted metalloprotease with PDZ domain
MNTSYPLVVFAEGQCQTLQVTPAVVVRNGLKTLYPPYDAVDYVAFMGLCIMPLNKNHSSVPQLAPAYVGLDVDELYQPHLVITHIFSGSKAEVVNAVRVGDFVVKVNGQPVTTLEDVRRSFKQPASSNMLAVETKRGRVLALKVDDVLREERENAALTTPLYTAEREIIDALG